MWEQCLDSESTEGQEFTPASPFGIRIEGDISGKTIVLQSKRRGDNSADWNSGEPVPVNETGALIPFYSFDDTLYRIVVSEKGLTAFWNTVFTSQTDLTKGR